MKSSSFRIWGSRLLGAADDLIAIAIAAVLLVAYQTRTPRPSDSDLLFGVLAVLSLIAISGLRDRVRRFPRFQEAIEQTHTLIADKIVETPKAEDFFEREAEADPDFFSSAREIRLAGITLGNTSRELANILGKRLVEGTNIRVIIVDSTDVVLQQIVSRSWGTTTTEYYRQRLENTHRLLEIIAETQGAKGTFEVGRLPFVPSIGIKLVEPSSELGAAFVKIYHHNTAEPNPVFTLTQRRDPHWFGFFAKQFDTMWRQCSVKTLTAPH